MTNEFEAILREWAGREHFYALATMRAVPLVSVPPGDDPKDWRLYVSTGARPLIDEIMRLGIWDPVVEEDDEDPDHPS